MMNRLEDLWKSADDGAMTPAGPLSNHTEAEFDEILDAWFLERRNTIEFEILLEQSFQLLKQILADESVNDLKRRKARRLVKSIRLALKTADAGEA